MSRKVPIAAFGDRGSERARPVMLSPSAFAKPPGPRLRYDFLKMRLAVSRKSLRAGCYDALTSALYASTQNLDTLRLRTLD
jgi:hypothetical protein